MSVGQRIKQARERLGITQSELARMVGITKQSLYKYEMSIITNIPSNKIESIAKKLQTTPAYLMGWLDEDNLYKNDDILTDIVFKFQADKDFREIVEDVYNASPELLNALKAFISAFKQ